MKTLLTCLVTLMVAIVARGGEPIFIPVKIDGPVHDPANHGQWNTYRITCRAAHIVVEVNGQKVNELDLDQWSEPHKNPDGSKNKFPRAIKDFARRGHIGLQDHGRPVWYRNIRIKPLDGTH